MIKIEAKQLRGLDKISDDNLASVSNLSMEPVNSSFDYKPDPHSRGIYPGVHLGEVPKIPKFEYKEFQPATNLQEVQLENALVELIKNERKIMKQKEQENELNIKAEEYAISLESIKNSYSLLLNKLKYSQYTSDEKQAKIDEWRRGQNIPYDQLQKIMAQVNDEFVKTNQSLLTYLTFVDEKHTKGILDSMRGAPVRTVSGVPVETAEDRALRLLTEKIMREQEEKAKPVKETASMGMEDRDVGGRVSYVDRALMGMEDRDAPAPVPKSALPRDVVKAEDAVGVVKSPLEKGVGESKEESKEEGKKAESKDEGEKKEGTPDPEEVAKAGISSQLEELKKTNNIHYRSFIELMSVLGDDAKSYSLTLADFKDKINKASYRDKKGKGLISVAQILFEGGTGDASLTAFKNNHKVEGIKEFIIDELSKYYENYIKIIEETKNLYSKHLESTIPGKSKEREEADAAAAALPDVTIPKKAKGLR